MLRRIDDDLWCHEAPVALAGGMHMPARMVVVGLAEGLWIHSPLAIDDALAGALAELGEVRHLVAPNSFHYLHLAAAIDRYPGATVHAPAALRAKQPQLRIDAELVGGRSPWPELDVFAIAGAPKLDEFVFVHRPRETLIVSDLVFNLHAVEGWMFPLVLRSVGAWRRLAQSRFWRLYTKDRAAAGASVDALLGAEISRLIPAHGDIVEGPETRERLADALAWMRAGSPTRDPSSC